MIYLPKSEKKGFSKGVENDRNNRFQIGIHSVIHISTSNNTLFCRVHSVLSK